jgi:hypothetical protein
MDKINKTLSEIIEYECRWYVRLWRWLFPSKPLTLKDIRRAVKRLKKLNG